MSNQISVLPALDVAAVTDLAVRPESLWREVRVVAETGSSNADLLAAARAGAAEGTVLVAEAQTAARGRLGRRWVSPPRAGLTFSVLLRPDGVPGALLGWLPLLTGVAAVAAVRTVAAVEASLKWPNDVLVGGAKLGGILAERAGSAVVAGIGINVWQSRADLPADAGATSLALLTAPGGTGPSPPPSPRPPPHSPFTVPLHSSFAGDPGLRERLLAELLAGLSHWYLAWRDQASPGDADACGLRQEYTLRCATLGRAVTVTMPGAEVITGTATGLDGAGRLEVRTARGLVPVTAGDVVHVRSVNDAGD
jgi:BirA family transcriptional regulator, biotin operon repressor / biotin---[acetyl-CoA-carboxylase] ligase